MICRGCGSQSLRSVLSLGLAPLPRWPDRPDADVPHRSLDLLQCQHCWLAQLSRTTDRMLVFRRYWYLSGVNEQMVANLRDVVRTARKWTTLRAGDTVIDVGANDGTLLAQYPRDVHTVAWEPARNLTPQAHEVVRQFFPTGTDDFASNQAKIVTTVAMFYDVDNLTDFAAGIRRLLAPGGVWVCELSDLRAMVETNGVDAVCHEHLTYWDEATFTAWAAREWFEVVSTQRVPINGGSLRFVLRSVPARPPVPKLPRTILTDWGTRLADVRQAILQAVDAAERPIDVVGASTKGLTLLHWLGFDGQTFRRAIDRSPAKIGRYYGTTGMRIVDEAAAAIDRAATQFVAIWQFRQHVAARSGAFLRDGGTLLVPLPEPAAIAGSGSRRARMGSVDVDLAHDAEGTA